MKKESAALDKEIKASNEIPAQQKQLWTSVKEKYEVILDSVKSMTDGIKSSAIATYCKDVLQGLKSIAKTAPKAIKQKLTQMAKNIQALMKKLTVQSSPVHNAKGSLKNEVPVISAEPVVRPIQVNENPRTAIEQTGKFNSTHRIDVGEKVLDGYKDAGRRVKFDSNGNIINPEKIRRETIVVDRTKDKKLQHLISDVKQKTKKMSEQQKADFLMEYIYNLTGDGSIAAENCKKWTKNNVGQDALLGDIVTNNPPVAVCRHRGLLFKVLGDEVGLKTELQRGNFYVDAVDNGGHAWNTVRFSDGTSAIYDPMHHRKASTTPGQVDNYALYYQDTKGNRLYDRGLSNNNPNVTPEPEVILAADNFNVGDKLPKEQGVVMAPNSKLLLADQVELDLSSPQIQSKLKNLKDGETLTIGREGDIVVGTNNKRISRKHLTIEKYGDNIIVKDTSANGTKFGALADDRPIEVNTNPRSVNSNIEYQNDPGISRGVLGTNPKLNKYVINPNKPAMKISQKARDYAEQWKTTPEHVQFCLDNTELFEGNETWECWSGFIPKNQKHGAWKMHMYSVDEKDWQKMSEVLIPYLRDHDIEWKTFNIMNGADCLNGGVQKGKAFTIYPRDNAHMEQVAKDLDYIIRNNNLETSGSKIVGDRAMGDNGRLFYRYEYNTGAVKDDVLDLSKDRAIYKKLYDSNSDRVKRHGEGRYLADDMTAADDPWLNFNPADPKSHATYNRNNSQNVTPEAEVLGGLYAADNFNVGDKLPKEQGVVMAPNSKLLLADQVELDLSSPQIQSKLKNLKDGETLTIGREGDIVVGTNNKRISRKHLTIEKYGDNIIVKDTSANGTKFGALADDRPIEVNTNPRSVNSNIEYQNDPGINYENNVFDPALDPAMYDPALYDPAVYDPNLNLFDDI